MDKLFIKRLIAYLVSLFFAFAFLNSDFFFHRIYLRIDQKAHFFRMFLSHLFLP